MGDSSISGVFHQSKTLSWRHMYIFKSNLNKKEREKIVFFINDTIDLYRDFYLTKNNIRLFIKENLHVLFDGLKKGNKIAYDKNGIAIVTGFSDKFGRHYVKLLSKNEHTVDGLLKIILWNLEMDLYCKIKKNNPIQRILKKNGFRFAGSRGKEILLKRIPINYKRK